jgi:3-phenylpropionate/trans-cinnamate dioxygenase ferredoxin subunit
MSNWQDVGSFSSLSEQEPLTTTVNGVPVGIFRVGTACHAIHDICTHEYARLSKGYVEGGVVECPLHEAKFDVRTGRCLAGPTQEAVAVYEVKIDADRVLVKV